MNENSSGSEEEKDSKGTGNLELAAGGALGALAVGEAAVGLAVCPFCVIGAPIFIGIGAYKKLKKKSRLD
ncbi:MAG: hypothetical protein ABH950_03050 [Candidatus Altiarchaeota archaeon]